MWKGLIRRLERMSKDYEIDFEYRIFEDTNVLSTHWYNEDMGFFYGYKESDLINDLDDLLIPIKKRIDRLMEISDKDK